MKARGAPDPYRYDAEGKLIVDQAESEEQRLEVEAAVLYKEGMSPNHPADVAASNAPTPEEPPVEPPDEEVDAPTRKFGSGSPSEDDHSKRDDERRGRHTPRGRDR